MRNPEISLEQWLAWLQDPVTQALRDWAKDKRDERRDMWEGGHFKTADHFESAIKDSAAQGACSVYREVEALEYESIMEGQIDEKPSRVEDGEPGDVPDGRGY